MTSPRSRSALLPAPSVPSPGGARQSGGPVVFTAGHHFSLVVGTTPPRGASRDSDGAAVGNRPDHQTV